MIKKFDKLYSTQFTSLEIIFGGKIKDAKLKNYEYIEEFFVEFKKALNEFKATGGKKDEAEKNPIFNQSTTRKLLL